MAENQQNSNSWTDVYNHIGVFVCHVSAKLMWAFLHSLCRRSVSEVTFVTLQIKVFFLHYLYCSCTAKWIFVQVH